MIAERVFRRTAWRCTIFYIDMKVWHDKLKCPLRQWYLKKETFAVDRMLLMVSFSLLLLILPEVIYTYVDLFYYKTTLAALFPPTLGPPTNAIICSMRR